MQCHTSTKEDVVVAVEFDEVFSDQIQTAGLGPPQRLDIAKPTVAILHVRFEPVCHVSCSALTHANSVTEFREAAVTLVAPHTESLLDDLSGEVVVSCQRTCREECRGRIEIGGSKTHRLVDTADSVSELDPGIPERIPDRAGDGLDLLGHPLGFDIVHQQEIEVALGGQFAAAVAPDRKQRHSASRSVHAVERIVEDVHHPVVGDLREQAAVVATGANDVGADSSEVPGTDRRGHSTIPANATIGAKPTATTIGATIGRAGRGTIVRSYVTCPECRWQLSYAGPP